MPNESLTFRGANAYDLIIDQPVKLVTIRAGEKVYGNGNVVQAVFPDVGHEGGTDPVLRSDELRIISQVRQRIGEIPPALLLMDGFLSPGEVTEVMNTHYPEQGPWTEESEVWRTFFVPAWFGMNDPVKQMRLFRGDQYYKKPDFELDLLRDPLLSRTFIWAAAYWWIEFHKNALSTFPQALRERQLIDPAKEQAMNQSLSRIYELSGKKSKQAEAKTMKLIELFMQGETV